MCSSMNILPNEFLVFIFHNFLNISWPSVTFNQSKLNNYYFHMKKGSHEIAKIAKMNKIYLKLRLEIWR